MFLIYGTRGTERKLGYVADFCPVCHTVRTFKLVRIGQVSHLYYISFGSGKRIGEVRVCETCGIALDAGPADYATVEKKPGADVSALLAATFPNLKTMRAERLALESRISSGLSADERNMLLFEPFNLLHSRVDALYTSSEMDRPAGIGCLTTLLLPIAIIWIGSYFVRAGSEAHLIGAGIVGGIALIYTFVQLSLVPGRFVRSTTLRQMARALSPLRPQEEEINRCLEKCRTFEWKFGKKVKAKQILAAIEEHGKGVL